MEKPQALGELTELVKAAPIELLKLRNLHATVALLKCLVTLPLKNYQISHSTHSIAKWRPSADLCIHSFEIYHFSARTKAAWSAQSGKAFLKIL